MDWTDFFSGLTNLGTSIASDVSGPPTPTFLPGALGSPGAYYVPNASGGQIIQPGGGLLGGGLAGGSSSILIILLIALALIFALHK